MRDRERRSVPRAQNLRKRMTEAEVILWSRLRRDTMYGMRFRKQHPVGPYVADFACVPARLIVEVDGATHSTPAERAHDRRRDAYLRSRGWRVCRVANEDIYRHLDDVLEWIARFVPVTPPAAPAAGTIGPGAALLPRS